MPARVSSAELKVCLAVILVDADSRHRHFSNQLGQNMADPVEALINHPAAVCDLLDRNSVDGHVHDFRITYPPGVGSIEVHLPPGRGLLRSTRPWKNALTVA